MVAGSVSSPTATPALEIRCHDRVGADEIVRVAAVEGHRLTVRERRQRAEAYSRRRETLGDLLLSMGGQEAALLFAEADVMVLTRGEVNRRANFDTANLRRQVVAARRQLAAIRALRTSGSLAGLDADLRIVAGAREAAPDVPLSELAEGLGLPRPTLARRRMGTAIAT
jgi:DNA-binding protein WhiA